MAANTTYPIPKLEGGLTIETIIGAVCHHFRISAKDTPSEKRVGDLPNARKAIVYLGTRLLHQSNMEAVDPEVQKNWMAHRAYAQTITYELAMALNRDHATILYLDNCAIELREKSERFKKLTDIIWAELTDAYNLRESAAE